MNCREILETHSAIVLMGVFVTFCFWWFCGSTVDERLGTIWLLAVFLPIFIVGYFVLCPRIPKE
jgi:hypothetical protein